MREEFGGPERLGQIVIRAGVEAGDAVVLRGACGEHDDGDAAALPHKAEKLKAVKVGKHDVQKDQIVSAGERAGEALAAVVRRLEPKAALGKQLGQKLTQLSVVVDEEDGRARVR